MVAKEKSASSSKEKSHRLCSTLPTATEAGRMRRCGLVPPGRSGSHGLPLGPPIARRFAASSSAPEETSSTSAASPTEPSVLANAARSSAPADVVECDFEMMLGERGQRRAHVHVDSSRRAARAPRPRRARRRASHDRGVDPRAKGRRPLQRQVWPLSRDSAGKPRRASLDRSRGEPWTNPGRPDEIVTQLAAAGGVTPQTPRQENHHPSLRVLTAES